VLPGYCFGDTKTKRAGPVLEEASLGTESDPGYSRRQGRAAARRKSLQWIFQARSTGGPDAHSDLGKASALQHTRTGFVPTSEARLPRPGPAHALRRLRVVASRPHVIAVTASRSVSGHLKSWRPARACFFPSPGPGSGDGAGWCCPAPCTG
jgi:hypothetical protein